MTRSSAEVLLDIERVLAGESPSNVNVVFRDPKSFQAEEIHAHLEFWEIVVSDYNKASDVLKWIG